MPSVSFLVPCYNASRFLQFTIDSLLRITDTNTEFIFVDDCSTDQTGSILRATQEVDSRVVVHTMEKNSGLSAVLNTGASIASGDFIARLDSDDLTSEDRLQKQFLKLVDKGLMVVGGSTRVINESGEFIKINQVKTGPASVERQLRLKGSCFAHSTATFRKKEFASLGGYSLRLNGVEDYDLWSRFSKLGSVDTVQDVVCDYRIHGNQITAHRIVERRNLHLVASAIHDASPLPLNADYFSESAWDNLVQTTESISSRFGLPSKWQELGLPFRKKNRLIVTQKAIVFLLQKRVIAATKAEVTRLLDSYEGRT